MVPVKIPVSPVNCAQGRGVSVSLDNCSVVASVSIPPTIRHIVVRVGGLVRLDRRVHRGLAFRRVPKVHQHPVMVAVLTPTEMPITAENAEASAVVANAVCQGRAVVPKG